MADTIEDIFAKRQQEYIDKHKKRRRRLLMLLAMAEGGGNVGPDVTGPNFTTATTGNNVENTVLSFTVSTNEPTTKVITGGADLARFEIVSGGTIGVSHTLRWLADTTKDFEAPDDVGTNNTYVVEITATDAALNATPQTITITVTDADEAPVIPAAPVLVWTSGTGVANPVFDLVLDAAVEGDTVQFEVADEATFTPADDDADDVLSAAEIIAGQLTPPLIALTSGAWFVRCRHSHDGSNWSAWSNTVTKTIDVTAPTVSTFNPADNATDIAINTTLVVTFAEAVVLGASGVITLKRTSDNVTIDSWDVATDGGSGAGQVEVVSGTQLTMHLTTNLANNIGYYVIWDASVVVDTAVPANGVAAQASTTLWSFTTVALSSNAVMTYRTQVASTGDLTTYTFSAVNIVSTTDSLIIGVAARQAATRSLVSVTVNGVAATQRVQLGSGGNTNHAALYTIANDGDSTPDIVVTWDGAMLRCGIAVWTIAGQASLVPTDTGSSTAEPGTDASLTIPTDGTVVGLAFSSSGLTHAWSAGLNGGEDFDTLLETGGSNYSGAHVNYTGAPGTTTVTVTYSGSAGALAKAVFASWGP